MAGAWRYLDHFSGGWESEYSEVMMFEKDDRHLQIFRQQLTVLTETVTKLENVKENPRFDEYRQLTRSVLEQTKALRAQAKVVRRQGCL